MSNAKEKIELTEQQLKALSRLGVDLKGQDLEISLISGKLPVILPSGKEMDEKANICITGC